MKVTEYNIENKYEETPQIEEKSEEPVDLIELVSTLSPIYSFIKLIEYG